MLCGSAGLEIFSPAVSHAATAAEGITARINPGGPENWPPEQALSTQTPGTPQPAPGQTMPGQPMPGQVMPGQPMPGQVMPGQNMPVQTAPGMPMTPAQGGMPQPAAQPMQTMPGQPMPAAGQTPMPGQNLPGQPMPGQTMPGQNMPVQTAPGMPMTPAQGTMPQPAAQPMQTMPGQPMPVGGQAPMPGQNLPGQPMPGQTMPGQNMPVQAAPGMPMTPAQGGMPQPAAQPMQTMPSQPMPGQNMPEQTAPNDQMAPAPAANELPPLPSNTGTAAQPAAPGDPAAGNAAAGKEQGATPKRDVIYVDEQGNPVEKPIDPEAVWQEATKAMEAQQYEDALKKLRILYDQPQLKRDRRLEVLYGISDCLWEMYKDKPQAGYDAIVSATSEALNADLRNDRAPDAYARLGSINLRIGNMDEARANMLALLRQYPKSPLVADSMTELGREQLKRKMYEDAAESFKTVLDNYPESGSMEEASMGLGKALVRLGRHKDASFIMDFVNKRWPRCYLNDTDFLLVQAENLEALRRNDAAMDVYWLFVNLQPQREGNNDLLLKMADNYTRGNEWNAASLMYQRIMKLWPGVSSSRVSQLRLAEKGIYDGPLNYEQMSALFARPAEDTPLERVYREIMEASQTSPECVLSRLKYAMWLLWDKQFTQAMGSAADFIDRYPEHPGVPQARDIIWTAFQSELGNALAEQNYRRILLLWNGFPLVRERYGELDPKMRYALAQGYMERGDEAKGLELLGAFLTARMDPDYGELALTEYFNRYLKAGAWDKILDLSKIVAGWPLRPQLRSQLEYATALSAQNLGLSGAALSRWRQLAVRKDIPLYQRAYATYFLARDAEVRKDVGDAYTYNKQVIELFQQLADERSDKADPERIKESIGALMDICEVANRVPEALEWVKRYSEYVPDANSPEYPGLRYREARLYRKLGDNTRAQFLLEDVVKRFPDSPFGKAAASELRTFEVSRDLKDFMPGGSAGAPAPAQGGGNAAAPAGNPPANP